MATSSWKTPSLLGAILLIALGLQVGSIKTMITLNSPDKPAITDADPTRVEEPPHLATPPATPAHSAPSPESATLPAHSAPNPESATLPAHSAPNPEAGPSAHSTPSPEAAAATHRTPSPEAAAATHKTPSPEAALPAHSAPSPEAAAMPAHSSMVSNIPPPIELDPEPPQPAAAVTSPEATAEAASAEVTPPAESPASTTALQEPQWLKSRDPNRYTVQLYSGKDMAKLREIAGSVAGAAPPAYFVTTSRSGPWYSLVVGDYPDFTAAQAVATQIAAESSTMKPWIRRFSEIQARMR